MERKKKEEQDWRMMQLPKGLVWPCEERKARLEKMLATKRLRLAMETDEERKARLEQMVATTQLKLALETEE